jgi:hypothetical protein
MSSILAMREFARACSSRAGVKSKPVTRAPLLAAVIATTPVPVPTSKTFSPDLIPVNLINCAATGVVNVAAGVKEAHISR